MIGYGLAKAATHHLATSLAAMVKKGSNSSEENQDSLPTDTSVITILPKVIDTPNNRKYMADQEPFDDWAKPEEIADEIKLWSEDLSKRPVNGSFVRLNTKHGKTSFDLF